MKRTAIALSGTCALGALSLILYSASLAEDAPKAATPAAGAYELVAPLGSVMEIASDVFARMPDKVKSAKPKDFRELRREAFFLAEVGNLSGQLKARAGEKVWKEMADVLKKGGLAMAGAAEKKDPETFKAEYAKVKDSCSGCHDKYRDN